MSISPEQFKTVTDALATITTKLGELTDSLQEAKDEINDNIDALLKETQERLLKVSEFQEKILEPNQQKIYKLLLQLGATDEDAKTE